MFYATDDKATKTLQAYNLNVFESEEVQNKLLQTNAQDYGTLNYQRLILSRTKHTLEMLRQGHDVLIVDVDTVLLGGNNTFYVDKLKSTWQQISCFASVDNPK